MAVARKLQTEIQQMMKKVQTVPKTLLPTFVRVLTTFLVSPFSLQVDEGVDIFNDIYHKVYSTDQQKLKEKYESDLKTEIKKLQRMRDQIKTWLAGNDIKDKNQLVEARKVIEEKMELFRVCEKETKTKAFSKEGLARQASTDPKDAEREEKRAWVNGCLERLQVRAPEGLLFCLPDFTSPLPMIPDTQGPGRPGRCRSAEADGQRQRQRQKQGAAGQVRQPHPEEQVAHGAAGADNEAAG